MSFPPRSAPWCQSQQDGPSEQPRCVCTWLDTSWQSSFLGRRGWTQSDAGGWPLGGCPAQALEPQSSLHASNHRTSVLGAPHAQALGGVRPSARPSGQRHRQDDRGPQGLARLYKGTNGPFHFPKQPSKNTPKRGHKRRFRTKNFYRGFYLCECLLSFIPLQGIRRLWAEAEKAFH